MELDKKALDNYITGANDPEAPFNQVDWTEKYKAILDEPSLDWITEEMLEDEVINNLLGSVFEYVISTGGELVNESSCGIMSTVVSAYSLNWRKQTAEISSQLSSAAKDTFENMLIDKQNLKECERKINRLASEVEQLEDQEEENSDRVELAERLTEMFVDMDNMTVEDEQKMQVLSWLFKNKTLDELNVIQNRI